MLAAGGTKVSSVSAKSRLKRSHAAIRSEMGAPGPGYIRNQGTQQAPDTAALEGVEGFSGRATRRQQRALSCFSRADTNRMG
jgi:hypothetical protein